MIIMPRFLKDHGIDRKKQEEDNVELWEDLKPTRMKSVTSGGCLFPCHPWQKSTDRHKAK